MVTVMASTRTRATARALPRALGLAGLIVLSEYVARRFVVHWLPTLGTHLVNDMLAFVVCYVPLVLLTAPAAARTPRAIVAVLRQIVARARTRLPWLGVVAALGAAGWLGRLDHLLWGRVPVPGAGWGSPLSSIVLVPQAGQVLTVVSLLLVNGLLVPVCEERLWRGLIQPRLVAGLGFVPGLALTAVLFSLKHVIVDASLGRLLAIVGAGLVVGVIAARSSWKTSAVTHIATNTVATLLVLAGAGGTV